MVDKLKSYIQQAERILITSHISPDPDALTSTLLLGSSLRLNFPDKDIQMVLEEEPVNLEFLSGYQNLKFGAVAEALRQQQPNLFILLDGNNYERCSRHDGQVIRDFIAAHQVKTVIIDHHEPEAKDEADIYINNASAATVEDVYRLCFDELGLHKPEGYAQTAMLGLYADSGGFAYIKDGTEKKLFDFAEELVSAGAQIEQAKNLLNRYSEADIKVLSELFTNLTHQDDYNYSFLPDEFISAWLAEGHTPAAMQPATGTFLNEYVRNIDGRQWGFIVYRNTLQGENIYSVSLRAVNGVKDVLKIASTLGGGGHKPAAGAKFAANSLAEAIAKVKNAIQAD